MSHLTAPSRRKSPLQPVLMWGFCALAFGLLALRCFSIYTAPPAVDNQHPLSKFVTAIVGQGNALIDETATGDLLILLNGPTGAIDPAIAAQLTELVQTTSGNETGPVLKQLPFAKSAGFNPTETELAELAGLGLLAGLALLLAFASRSHTDPAMNDPRAHAGQSASDMTGFPDVSSDTLSPPPFDVGPQLAPVEMTEPDPRPHALADAQSFAQANPEVTAKVIETWIRARGFKQ